MYDTHFYNNEGHIALMIHDMENYLQQRKEDFNNHNGHAFLYLSFETIKGEDNKDRPLQVLIDVNYRHMDSGWHVELSLDGNKHFYHIASSHDQPLEFKPNRYEKQWVTDIIQSEYLRSFRVHIKSVAESDCDLT